MHEIIHLLTDTTKTMLPFSFKHFFGSLEQRSNQKEDSIPYTHKVYRHTWTTIVATMRRSQLTEFSYFSLYDVVYNGGHFSDNFKNVLLVQSQSLIFGFLLLTKNWKEVNTATAAWWHTSVALPKFVSIFVGWNETTTLTRAELPWSSLFATGDDFARYANQEEWLEVVAAWVICLQ